MGCGGPLCTRGGSIEATFPLTRSSHRSAERIFGLQCFHVVCFHYGGAEVGRRRVSAADLQEWVLEPFFHSALQSGSGFETIGLTSLEVSKPRY